MKEIGGEFWRIKPENSIKIIDRIDRNFICVLSGRTALDFIIRDIKSTRKVESAMLPSYCCESMIEPFIRNNIKVEFYKVDEDNIYYECSGCDIVLLMDYFGYIDFRVDKIANEAKHKGQIVIYDSTHYLGDRDIVADYIFCSFRKWFYCNYAIVEKCGAEFSIAALTEYNGKYIETRNTAAKLKNTYIHDEMKAKSKFLKLYSVAEDILEKDYVNYAGQYTEVDIASVISARKNNARRLIEGLKDLKELKIWRSIVGKEDTPLFVPILVSSEIRNKLRKYLIENSIYCPIHWPLTDLHGEYREIFDQELSIICDQRYSSEDIDREIEMIRRFFEGGQV